MRIAIVGAGPAGLYLSYLLKRRDRAADVRVFEQNPAGATFGFGVVFSDRALEFLREDDPETYAAITPAMESWSDITLDLEGKVVRIDGVGFSAVGRLELLRLLQARVEAVGVRVEFNHPVASLQALADADLLVGADGVNSLVRRSHAKELGASVALLTNKFAWYGTTRRFDTLTQTFRRNGDGAFNAHHYRYSPDMSTFIVETDAATWARAGFAAMNEQATTTYLERVFADVLAGEGLVSNKSVWRNFPKVANARWSAGNAVLLGDALHTAHFSIGSGTRLAMEDAIALARALQAHPTNALAAARAYEAARRPILDKLTAAADASAQWYERFAEHMTLPPLEFAMSYITRSGRVSLERLRAVSPRFVAAFEGRATRV
ncbi:MAG: FAD-dependent monooxygenase [Betaproteobacteria bacterium]|nr:FAD-dependent monooxygenase [Betaproteobacteria bacterium]